MPLLDGLQDVMARFEEVDKPFDTDGKALSKRELKRKWKREKIVKHLTE